eukprot:scaffold21388_cov19-Tisochrysis_lutea.AAC.1
MHMDDLEDRGCVYAMHFPFSPNKPDFSKTSAEDAASGVDAAASARLYKWVGGSAKAGVQAARGALPLLLNLQRLHGKDASHAMEVY